MKSLCDKACQQVSGGITIGYSDPNETIIGVTNPIADANGRLQETLIYAYGLGTGQLYYYNEKYISLNDLKPSITTYPYPEISYNFSSIAGYLP